MNWSDEQVEILKLHHGAGLSASQSAAIIGVTRNAVIGKWGRLGLPQRRSGGMAPRAQRPPGLPPATTAKPGTIPQAVRAALRRRAAPPILITESKLSSDDIPRQQRRTMATLGERHCRWPCGDPGAPDFFFCGGVRKDADIPIDRGGVPYCATHCQVAFVAVPRRRTPYVYRGPHVSP